MPEPVIQRIVPGAPPPTPLSKTQKKKRKAKAKSAEPGDTTALLEATSATLTEKTPETQEAALAPEVIAQSDSQMSLLPEEEVLLKPSPIVDLIHKRLKATTKKIVLTLILSNTVWLILFSFQSRISIYAATDPEKLNDDQKRTLKTLPTLEAVQKELGEVKKAVEVCNLFSFIPTLFISLLQVHESELVHELTAKRIEVEKADKVRIANAVSAAEVYFPPFLFPLQLF